jgi:2,5-diamino-6-(ribosylamino)-4(3H)-pyrimidinone 5'-phosphate reductase
MDVIAHVAVSLDGGTTGFQPDVARYYDLARTFREDVTLTGADTILAQEGALAAAPRAGPAAEGPLLAVVDGRGRVEQWAALRECGRWRDVVALTCEDTPSYANAPRTVVAGRGRVDLAAALREVGSGTVRVDSGGALIGALLERGLLTEVSLLVHPLLAGPDARRWYGGGTAPAALSLLAAERQEGGLIWLRYRVSGG